MVKILIAKVTLLTINRIKIKSVQPDGSFIPYSFPSYKISLR